MSNISREIIDESDVYVDVHKAIRRLAPAPRTRVPKGKVVPDSEHAEDTYLKGIKGSVENQTKGRQTVNRASSAANVNRLNKVFIFFTAGFSVNMLTRIYRTTPRK